MQDKFPAVMHIPPVSIMIWNSIYHLPKFHSRGTNGHLAAKLLAVAISYAHEKLIIIITKYSW